MLEIGDMVVQGRFGCSASCAGHLARDCPNPKAKPGTGPAGGGNSESGNSLALKVHSCQTPVDESLLSRLCLCMCWHSTAATKAYACAGIARQLLKPMHVLALHGSYCNVMQAGLCQGRTCAAEYVVETGGTDRLGAPCRRGTSGLGSMASAGAATGCSWRTRDRRHPTRPRSPSPPPPPLLDASRRVPV